MFVVTYILGWKMKRQLLRSDLKMDIVSMPLTNVKEKRGLKYGESLNKARMHKVRKLQLVSIVK